MTTFQITSTAQQVRPNWSGQMTLFNNGVTTIYLDSSSAVSPATSYPLTPGTSLTWDSNVELWAIIQPIASTSGNLTWVSQAFIDGFSAPLVVSPSAISLTLQANNRLPVFAGTTQQSTGVGGGTVFLGMLETGSFDAFNFYFRPSLTDSLGTRSIPLVISATYLDIDPYSGALSATSIDTYFAYVYNAADGWIAGWNISIPIESGKGRYVAVQMSPLNYATVSGSTSFQSFGAFKGVGCYIFAAASGTILTSGSDFQTEIILPVPGGFFTTPLRGTANSIVFSTTWSNYNTTPTYIAALAKFLRVTAMTTVAGPANSVIALSGAQSTANYARLSTVTTGVLVEESFAIPAEGLKIGSSGGNTGVGQLSLTYYN